MKFCFFFNLFEVNDKDTSFWCLYCWLWTNVTYCSDVSVDYIKQVNASWVMISLIFAKILHFFWKMANNFVRNFYPEIFHICGYWGWILRKNIHICPRNTYINSFHGNVLFLYPLKTSEKPAISSIHTEYGEIRSISPYLVRMRENASFLSFLGGIEMEH